MRHFVQEVVDAAHRLEGSTQVVANEVSRIEIRVQVDAALGGEAAADASPADHLDMVHRDGSAEYVAAEPALTLS